MEGKKKKGLKIYNVVIDLPKGLAYDGSTGELIEESDIDELIEDAELENSLYTATTKALLKIFGISEDEVFCKYSWKKNSWFIKIYRTEMRKYKKDVKLSSNAGLVLLYLQDYIEHKTNRITTTDGNSLTNKEMQDLTGLGRDSMQKALNELEEKMFIVRVGKKRAREIYFNPYLMCSGNIISKDTLSLFDDYVPITPY